MDDLPCGPAIWSVSIERLVVGAFDRVGDLGKAGRIAREEGLAIGLAAPVWLVGSVSAI